jgi:Fe(3+) dicitrate transport protein
MFINTLLRFSCPFLIGGSALFLFLISLQAAEPTIEQVVAAKAKLDQPVLTETLNEVVVKGKAVRFESPLSSFLPATQGTQVYTGKKTTVTYLENRPQVQNNNYRQVFSQTPGLLIAEHTNVAQINMNYRGIGDPHESEQLLNLKNGIPQAADWFGYSTLYALPPMESVGRVEFIRGGSSLLYGPQPGPVVNYVTKRPPTDKKITGSSQQVAGSDGLYSTYNTVGGTVDRVGYSLNYYHKQQDGTRDNADSTVNGGNIQIALDADKSTRWFLEFNIFDAESGEPGRLSAAQYALERDTTTTPSDRIFTQRHSGSLTIEHDISEDTLLITKAWAGYQERLSRRSGAANTSATIDSREFQFGGADARILHNYELWGNKHTLTGGFTVYSADNPRNREIATGDPLTTDGVQVFDSDNTTNYGAYFVENKFTLGNLSIVPSLRVENIAVNVKENTSNLARGPQEADYIQVVPLLGLALEYNLGKQNAVYANASQGYRPQTYDALLNPTVNAQPNSNLEESKTWTYELGFRGQPTTWMTYDTSVFYTDYDNYFETTGAGANTITSNSGRAIFQGWEAAMEIDFVGLYDSLNNSDVSRRFGTISAYSNISLLSAQFVAGTNDGREPGYAPEYVYKTGTIYRYSDKVKIALIGTMLGNHDWQDSNAPANGIDEIPAYGVWDLTGEFAIYKDYVKLLGGINNLFDEDYFSRVRGGAGVGNGIEPAARRNFYVGVNVSF